MDAITALEPSVFNDYLKKTGNTICGRNPICVMLQVNKTSKKDLYLSFLRQPSISVNRTTIQRNSAS